MMHAVIAEVDGLQLALPVAALREMMRALPTRSLGDGIGLAMDAAIVRGEVVPVLDAGLLLGRPAGSRGRWLALRVGERTVVLAVDRVVALRRLDLDLLAQTAELIAAATPAAIAALQQVDGQLLAVLEAGRILDGVDASTLAHALAGATVALHDVAEATP